MASSAFCLSAVLRVADLAKPPEPNEEAFFAPPVASCCAACAAANFRRFSAVSLAIMMFDVSSFPLRPLLVSRVLSFVFAVCKALRFGSSGGFFLLNATAFSMVDSSPCGCNLESSSLDKASNAFVRSPFGARVGKSFLSTETWSKKTSHDRSCWAPGSPSSPSGEASAPSASGFSGSGPSGSGGSSAPMDMQIAQKDEAVASSSLGVSSCSNLMTGLGVVPSPSSFSAGSVALGSSGELSQVILAILPPLLMSQSRRLPSESSVIASDIA
mmetsp:Transcript_43317/g.68648  ORF Transcript_43317/g.68648 Transcript_43317/m.68648 type:complete len:271 (-) Transcript_43317:1466-2278(-)